MTTTGSKPPRPRVGRVEPAAGAWLRLLRRLRHGTFGGANPPDTLAATPPARLLDPLERIRDYLGRRGLDRQVRVHPEPTGRGFVLEDDDGCVHADDYDAAVAMIGRIWLYQP